MTAIANPVPSKAKLRLGPSSSCRCLPRSWKAWNRSLAPPARHAHTAVVADGKLFSFTSCARPAGEQGKYGFGERGHRMGNGHEGATGQARCGHRSGTKLSLVCRTGTLPGDCGDP